MRIMAEKMFIYSLSHPTTGCVFYIGQSKNVYIRVLNHVQKCHLLKGEKDRIINEICSLGLLPKWDILEEIEVDLKNILSITNVSNRENFWIQKFNTGGALQNIQKIPKPRLINKGAGQSNSKECLRCGHEFEPKNPKGKFCSDVCRVYWNRMKKANDKLGEAVFSSINDFNKQTNEIKPPEQPTTNYTINTQRIYELEEELKSIPDTTKGLGKKLAESIKKQIFNLKYK